MMRRLCSYILIFLFPALLLAQRNDSLHYYVGYSSTGTYNRTNNFISYLFSNNLNFSVKREALKANFQNKWLYGEQQSKLVNNDFSSTFDLNLYKTFPHFYYWALCTYNTAYSLKINSQLQFGFGGAYNLIDKKNFQLNISDGILYDYSDIYIQDTIRDIYQTPRNSFRLQIRFLWKRLNFQSISFLQNSLQRQSDYIFRTDNTLGLKIKSWLSLTAKFSYNRMNRTDKENLFVTYGLTIDKSF